MSTARGQAPPSVEYDGFTESTETRRASNGAVFPVTTIKATEPVEQERVDAVLFGSRPRPPMFRARRSEHQSQSRPRPRGAGRPKVRGAAKRSGARSGDSGDDSSDEPEPEPRLCACGCGQSIAHKRAGAQTFDAACRKRVSRNVPAVVLADDVREERARAWSEVAGQGTGNRYLTDQHDAELLELAASERVARSRATTPRRSEIDALAVVRWLMETNGTATSGLSRRSPWRTSSIGGLRTRPEMVA